MGNYANHSGMLSIISSLFGPHCACQDFPNQQVLCFFASTLRLKKTEPAMSTGKDSSTGHQLKRVELHTSSQIGHTVFFLFWLCTLTFLFCSPTVLVPRLESWVIVLWMLSHSFQSACNFVGLKLGLEFQRKSPYYRMTKI